MSNNSFKQSGANVINTEFLEIKGNLVRCNSMIIQMSNISVISLTDFPKIPFPILSIFIGLLGIFCLVSGSISGHMTGSMSEILLGVLLGVLMIEVSALIIWLWKRKKIGMKIIEN